MFQNTTSSKFLLIYEESIGNAVILAGTNPPDSYMVSDYGWKWENLTETVTRALNTTHDSGATPGTPFDASMTYDGYIYATFPNRVDGAAAASSPAVSFMLCHFFNGTLNDTGKSPTLCQELWHEAYYYIHYSADGFSP